MNGGGPPRLRTVEVEYTREKLLGELEQARQIAEQAKNGSAMAMATMGKAQDPLAYHRSQGSW
jgi:hypothetical protein